LQILWSGLSKAQYLLAIGKELQLHGLSWQNYPSFDADNASIMQYKHNGIAHSLHKEPWDVCSWLPMSTNALLTAQKACSSSSITGSVVCGYILLPPQKQQTQSLQQFQLFNGKEMRNCERMFSFVIKIRTAFFPSLSTKTLSSLIVHKVSLNVQGTTETFQCFPG